MVFIVLFQLTGTVKKKLSRQVGMTTLAQYSLKLQSQTQYKH